MQLSHLQFFKNHPMFSPSEIENILFLDIETASAAPVYADLPERMQTLWDKKSRRYQRQEPDMDPPELYTAKAGIHAEFARVVVISCGYVQFDEEGIPQVTMKSYADMDERNLLAAFGDMLDRFMRAKPGRNLCAHNGKEFDFPFLGRRFLINGLKLPLALQIQGKKPWEIPYVDTMELWKFGDFKAYTSLDLLAGVFGIPTPKDDIDGSQVGRVFWEEKDLERIKVYCEKDVETTIQVLLKMSGLPLAP